MATLLGSMTHEAVTAAKNRLEDSFLAEKEKYRKELSIYNALEKSLRPARRRKSAKAKTKAPARVVRRKKADKSPKKPGKAVDKIVAYLTSKGAKTVGEIAGALKLPYSSVYSALKKESFKFNPETKSYRVV